MASTHRPYVSVILCVVHELESLRLCLEALGQQSYDAEDYEIIVVNNGDIEDLASLISSPPQVRIVREKSRGLSNARNTGILLSHGEVLAMTDVDCLPSPSWIEQGVLLLLEIPNCGLVAGAIDMSYEQSDRPTTAAEHFESVTAFRQKEYIDKYRFGVTANLFAYRETFNQIGMFRTDLISGADLDWGQRVFAAGHQLIYSDSARITHPARSTIKALVNKHTRVVGGLHQRQKQSGSPLLLFLAHLLKDWPQLKHFKQILTDVRLEGAKPKSQVLFVMIIVKVARLTEMIRLRMGGTPRWR